MEDFQGNQEADIISSGQLGRCGACSSQTDYLFWEVFAHAVRHFWLLVGPKLCERPEAWCGALVLPSEVLPRAPREVGPHKRVV
eukprot:3368950-Amphidinium_carterae.2